jgi:cytochrome P450
LEATDPTEEARLKGVDAIQDTAATIFGTAADTTASALLTHIFALATHPHVRKGIQEQLDTVLVERDSSGVQSLDVALGYF